MEKTKESLSLALAKLILTVAMIVSGGSLIGAIGYLVSHSRIMPSITIVPTITIQPSPTEVLSMENWHTYRNEDYGFELKYPATDWTIGGTADFISFDHNAAKTNFADMGINISIGNSSAQNSFAEATKPLVPGETDTRFSSGQPDGEIIIDKHKGYKVIDSIEGYNSKTIFLEKDKNSSFVINFTYSADSTSYGTDIDSEKCPEKECYNTLNNIISTFKVIEKDKTDDSFLSNCKPIISLPFHNGGKMLRVYNFKDPNYYDNYNNPVVQCVDPPDSIDPGNMSEELKMFVYDTRNKSSNFIGSIKGYYGANSGGLFVPYAITKDDSKVILDAHMGGPGAGGGMIDYGYAMVSIRSVIPNAAPLIGQNSEIVRFPYDFPEERTVTSASIAPRAAHFYDSFGKVVYVDEGNKTPHYAMPGPSNDGAIMFRNLVTNIGVKKILEEKDTSYEIISIDEKNKILKFKAIKYSFSADCLREEDAFSLNCAGEKITERVMPLP